MEYQVALGFEQTLIQMGVLVAGIFALSDIIHRAWSRFDVGILNIIIGGISGPIAYAAGWLQIATPGVTGWVVSVYVGVICSALAAVGHDKLVNPIIGKKLKKGG